MVLIQKSRVQRTLGGNVIVFNKKTQTNNNGSLNCKINSLGGYKYWNFGYQNVSKLSKFDLFNTYCIL